jgi:glycosyltransferase involved in cell wall biosynthesis
MLMLPKYVLITPARNESEFIELTLQSVVAQTVRPIKWIIVSDGSTDGTDEIVCKYTANHPWIELVRMPERRERHFAGKVQAFDTGYARVRQLDFDVVGNLDADVSFGPEYFSYLLGKLAEDRSLGLVGTAFKEGTNPPYDYRYVNIEHVTGCCQVFRRECFEEIGGYVPVKGGCIDHIAVINARMKGWKTRTFTDIVYQHHREMGTAEQGLILSKLKNGRKDYIIGNHPVWELFRAAYQATRKPYVVGSLMLLSGYFGSVLRRVKRPVSDEFVSFVRREQMLRLRRILTGNRTTSSGSLRRPSQRI